MLLPLLVFALGQETAVAPEETIPLQPLAGPISVWRAATDKVEPAERAGARVTPGDRLGTAAGEPGRFATEGPLQVLMRGIKAAKGQGLALERKSGRLLLKLYKGTVVVESYESEIELETPFGKVAGKQVYFMASVDEKSARVWALDGKLSFASDLGSVTLAEGTASEAEKGKPPSPPRPMTPAEADQARLFEADLNLIRNGGFEQRLEDWTIDFLPAQEDLKVVRSGKRSLRVTLKDVRPSDPILPSKSVKGLLKPGAKYLFRYYVRAEGYRREGGPAEVKLVLDRTGKGSVADPRFHFEREPVEGEWAARRVSFQATGPDLWFCLYAGTAGGRYNGALWFDDFFLAEIPAGPKPK